MKRLFSLVILVTVVVVSLQSSAIQASDIQKESPKSVIENYLNAVLSKDYKTASLYISESNEEIREWLDFLNYVSNKAPEKLISIINLAHCLTRHQNIKTISSSDKSAVVEVESVVPDMEKIFQITQSEAEIKKLFQNNTMPVKHKTGTFILLKENNDWKINKVEGVSGDSVGKLAMDLAEKILSKEEALKLRIDISDYQEGLASN